MGDGGGEGPTGFPSWMRSLCKGYPGALSLSCYWTGGLWCREYVLGALSRQHFCLTRPLPEAPEAPEAARSVCPHLPWVSQQGPSSHPPMNFPVAVTTLARQVTPGVQVGCALLRACGPVAFNIPLTGRRVTSPPLPRGPLRLALYNPRGAAISPKAGGDGQDPLCLLGQVGFVQSSPSLTPSGLF